MAKKTKRSYGSIIIISIIFVITLGINLFIYFQNEKLKSNYQNLETNYQDILKEKEDKEKTYNELKEKLELVNNIDTTIEETKNDFFTKAKQLEDKILAGETNAKIAYLTFDDGPYYLSYEFLRVLDEADVLATFFTIGNNKQVCYDKKDENCYPLYALEASKGHTMANHTFSHGIWYGLYDSPSNFMTQVKKQEQLLIEQAGVKPNIVRFPGGSGTAKKHKNAIIELLRQNGYGWVDWSASTGDGGSLTDYNVGWNNFTNSINSNIEVVLMHDYNKITLQMLPNEIKYLRENGYHIFPLFYESNMVNK